MANGTLYWIETEEVVRGRYMTYAADEDEARQQFKDGMVLDAPLLYEAESVEVVAVEPA